ncbi:sporulation protein YhbH [Calderihabitans maritimus]|uniref:Sporulation protein YhbH n=1 Tax=Calderihabitans maritimus TaxID=1246530 RepID=A0A1Z5HP08_9FIRM|nr:sporulation protein YhbH [Calderihabitans maritimus]GAW91262.1 sporulation protein YhbH [Calderihabitans maritimus]
MDTGGKNFLISREDWSLHRKGYLDQQRHQEKVKEAIRNNLPDIISEESIIMSDGNKVIKIPIRSLEEYRFRYNFRKQQHAGQGDGKSKVGDVLGSDPKSGADKGSGAGDKPGIDYYEAEITLDELAEIVFEEFTLPNLEEKKKRELEDKGYRFNDIRKKGLMSNIDRKRTLLENLKRNAIRGRPGIYNITPEDLRFKTWEVTPRYESNAVVLAMMDTSGSMGTYEKYMARSFFFWMVRFLRTKYKQVEIVFLAHHTQAKEVTEEEFFTKGESGGTKCSSVYELALNIIHDRYPPQDYNLYPFHFSDGDNLPSDNERCITLVRKLLTLCNLFGYCEIVNPYYRSSTLMSVYKRIEDPKFVKVTVKEKSDVYTALRIFFSDKEKVAGH